MLFLIREQKDPPVQAGFVAAFSGVGNRDGLIQRKQIGIIHMLFYYVRVPFRRPWQRADWTRCEKMANEHLEEVLERFGPK